MQTAHATDAPMSGLTPSQIMFRAAHRARLARIAEAAARRPAPVSKTRDYQPFVTEVVEIAPNEPETPEQWAERQKAIPLPRPPYEPWFHIEADITPVVYGPKNISVAKIQRETAIYYGMNYRDMFSIRRTAKVVRPRQVAMYLAKALTSRSLPELGRRFGNRDHTTILHGIRKIEGLIKNDPTVANDVSLIEAACMEGA